VKKKDKNDGGMHGREWKNKYVSDKGVFLILLCSLTVLLADLQIEIS